MPIRYFKKESPANKPILSNNVAITFQTFDNVTGYFATDQPYIHQQFEMFMRVGEYGISELTAEEYAKEFLEKKNQPRGGRLWREEFAPGTPKLGESSSPQPAKAVVAAEPQNVAVAAPTPPTQQSTKPDFKPQPAKRAKKTNQPAV